MSKIYVFLKDIEIFPTSFLLNKPGGLKESRFIPEDNPLEKFIKEIQPDMLCMGLPEMVYLAHILKSSTLLQLRDYPVLEILTKKNKLLGSGACRNRRYFNIVSKVDWPVQHPVFEPTPQLLTLPCLTAEDFVILVCGDSKTEWIISNLYYPMHLQDFFCGLGAWSVKNNNMDFILGIDEESLVTL